MNEMADIETRGDLFLAESGGGEDWDGCGCAGVEGLHMARRKSPKSCAREGAALSQVREGSQYTCTLGW